MFKILSNDYSFESNWDSISLVVYIVIHTVIILSRVSVLILFSVRWNFRYVDSFVLRILETWTIPFELLFWNFSDVLVVLEIKDAGTFETQIL